MLFAILLFVMKLFGQEKICGMDVLVLYNQLMALVMNVYAWIVSTFIPAALVRKHAVPPHGSTCSVSIQGPGGLDQVLHILEVEAYCPFLT